MNAAHLTSGEEAEHGRSAGIAVRAMLEQLEEDIVLGLLHPRERLTEDALIERFGAKRHAVRAALAELERLGLVERQPNRGAAVRELTPAEVRNIYAVREILETAAAREIIRKVTPALLATITQAQRLHDKATAAKDARAIFRANIAFHRALFAACENSELIEAIERLAQKAHPVRSFSTVKPEYQKRARDDHWAMIEALRAGNERELVALCRDHIRFAPDDYIQAYHLRFPQQQPANTKPGRRNGAPHAGAARKSVPASA